MPNNVNTAVNTAINTKVNVKTAVKTKVNVNPKVKVKGWGQTCDSKKKYKTTHGGNLCLNSKTE